MNRRMQGTETLWNDADRSEAILQVQAASPSVAMSAYRASAVPTGLPAHSSTQTAQTRVRKKSKAGVHAFAYVGALLVAMSSDEVDLESLLPEVWIAAHPEYFLPYRRDEAEAAANARRRRRALRREKLREAQPESLALPAPVPTPSV